MNDDFFFEFRPRELKLEITRACNLSCSFCYQGQVERQASPHAPEARVLAWIDWAVENGLDLLRFTGGEPTMHPEIKFFCNYAHLRGLGVILNTNGLGPAQVYADLLRVVGQLQLSLPSLDADRLDQICGHKGALAGKLATMRQALEAGRGVALLTALLSENKGRLDRFVRLAQDNPGVVWAPLRLKATPDNLRPWSRQDAQDFALEMAGLMDAYPEQARGIRLATPFCAVRPTALGARVFSGKAEQCGPYHSLVVALDGTLHSCYGTRESLQRGGLRQLAQSPELLAGHGLKSLPDQCQACPHVGRCGGGCRNWPGLVEHNGHMVDYLAGFLPDNATAAGR